MAHSMSEQEGDTAAGELADACHQGQAAAGEVAGACHPRHHRKSTRHKKHRICSPKYLAIYTRWCTTSRIRYWVVAVVMVLQSIRSLALPRYLDL